MAACCRARRRASWAWRREDITITGLEHHEPETLLAAIGVQPGGSLIGFDAGAGAPHPRSLDWIESAKVQRLFPNQLAVEVKEREPFAIWQRGEAYYVIDKIGRRDERARGLRARAPAAGDGRGRQHGGGGSH